MLGATQSFDSKKEKFEREITKEKRFLFFMQDVLMSVVAAHLGHTYKLFISSL